MQRCLVSVGLAQAHPNYLSMHTYLASSAGLVPGSSNGTPRHSVVHCIQPCHMTLAVTAGGRTVVSLTGLNEGEGNALTALFSWSAQ